MSTKPNLKKLLSLLLAGLLVVSITACGKREPEPVPSESEPGEDQLLEEPEEVEEKKIFLNPLTDLDASALRIPKRGEDILEYVPINDHTVGWLEVPGTTINDVVVCNQDPGDYNNFYYRRNIYKAYAFEGLYYADFRNRFGEGDASSLSNNTVIYGHTLDMDIDARIAAGSSSRKFGPLKLFTQEEFAKKTPYVFFSTAKEDLVWEVFAVFFTHINLPYNVPGQSDAEFTRVIEECRARSIYNYDVDVSATDKVLTLSTCTYNVPLNGSGGMTNVGYPNDYRYVVMAKLVDRSVANKTEASFTVNASPKAPAFS